MKDAARSAFGDAVFMLYRVLMPILHAGGGGVHLTAGKVIRCRARDHGVQIYRKLRRRGSARPKPLSRLGKDKGFESASYGDDADGQLGLAMRRT